VYVLVEIGKLLEHDKAKGAYPAITFYRDWTVHTKLDRSALADDLVRLFDDNVTSRNTTASDKLKILVSPSMLRQELKKYLTHHHLNLPSCNDGVLWKRFVKYLAGVIDETFLHCSLRNRKNKTTSVESITVSRTRNVNGTGTLIWEAHCHNSPPTGVDTSIEVALLPDIDKLALP
jgi:hypothetical protein